MEPNKFSTLVEAEQDLRGRGYTNNMEIAKSGKMICLDTGKEYLPDEISIIEHHRFEGTSDPGDMSALYAIETNDHVKGLFIDAYGTYSSSEASDFLRKVIDIKQQGLKS